MNDLVRVADLLNTFSKGDTPNCSYKLYKVTEFFNDIIPSYHIDNLPEPYKEAMWKKTELSKKKR